MKTINRTIDEWGRTILSPDAVFELMYNGRVDYDTILVEDHDEINQYNTMCKTFDRENMCLATPEPMPHTPDEEFQERNQTWMIDDYIKDIPIRDFLITMCKDDEQRDRVHHEMDLFEERNLVPLLQLMIYLVDHFRTNNIVWGVGRGSSVASFCLFLIGVHKINPIKYGLDVHDFLK